MPRKLKVYRTPIGFHDAYVAAPSQKAALEAWGSDADLFARGVAEVVTDPALTKEPLASPGAVVRRLRGSADDHFAALPKAKPKKKPKPARATAKTGDALAPSSPPARPVKAKPRPSRAKLDAAETAIDALDQRHRAELAELRTREQALVRERHALERRQSAEAEKLAKVRERAKERYDHAIAAWRD
jgi:hypothetical protein